MLLEEFGDPAVFAWLRRMYAQGASLAGALFAVALTDRLLSGLSAVYTFFDPDLSARSLWTYTILWHIAEAARAGLPFFYLGYWIDGTRKMRYKTQFRPIEQLTATGWRPLPPGTGTAA